jgi:hypothetical protein
MSVCIYLVLRVVGGWWAIIILMALLKDDHHSRSLSDLVKISFKDSNYLSNSGKNITTAPTECMEELLSAVHLVQVRNADHGFEDDPVQPGNDEGTKGEGERVGAIKVGQLFHMRFYFTGESVYYDHHNNKLILSRERRTAFKIIEHISRAGNASKEQTYDYIGTHAHTQVVPFPRRQRRAPRAPLPDCLRQRTPLPQAHRPLRIPGYPFSHAGTYDERCIVTFAPSVFRMDKPPADTPLLHSPCRLYSV